MPEFRRYFVKFLPLFEVGSAGRQLVAVFSGLSVISVHGDLPRPKSLGRASPSAARDS